MRSRSMAASTVRTRRCCSRVGVRGRASARLGRFAGSLGPEGRPDGSGDRATNQHAEFADVEAPRRWSREVEARAAIADAPPSRHEHDTRFRRNARRRQARSLRRLSGPTWMYSATCQKSTSDATSGPSSVSRYWGPLSGAAPGRTRCRSSTAVRLRRGRAGAGAGAGALGAALLRPSLHAGGELVGRDVAVVVGIERARIVEPHPAARGR